jgi:hypothetical protein
MILEVLGSAGFGSLLGGIFGWLNKREERENMKMKFEHDIAKIQAKTNARIEIARMSIEEAQVAGELAVEKEEAKAFSKSQITSSIGDTIKAIVRPVIVGLLMWQTYQVHNSLEALTGGIQGLSSDDVMALYKVVVLMITGLTCTAVSWYFAARSSKQFDKLLDKWQ